jgi:hypothetical protein
MTAESRQIADLGSTYPLRHLSQTKSEKDHIFTLALNLALFHANFSSKKADKGCSHSQQLNSTSTSVKQISFRSFLPLI